MKKRLLIIMISLLAILLIGDNGINNSGPGKEKYIKKLNELKMILALDEIQFEKIGSAFSANESQRIVDVDIFKASSMAMVRAAERRRKITDSRIGDILTELQKDSFDKYKQVRLDKNELFRLKEGLLLSNKQEIQVELIIAEYEDILSRLYKRLDYYIKSGQDRKKKSSESGRLLKSRTGGLERRNPEVVRMEQGPPEKILEIQNEKAKMIKGYLTPDQSKLYPELLKFQEQELRSYIRKLRR